MEPWSQSSGHPREFLPWVDEASHRHPGGARVDPACQLRWVRIPVLASFRPLEHVRIVGRPAGKIRLTPAPPRRLAEHQGHPRVSESPLAPQPFAPE